MSAKMPLTVEGKPFPSLKAVADAFGLPVSHLSRRLRAGWTPEEAVGRLPRQRVICHPGTEIVWNDCRFSSIRELAVATGIKEGTLAKRLRDGKKVDHAVQGKIKRPAKKGKPIEFRGEAFDSWKALASRYGIKYQLFRRRVLRGWTIEQSLTLAAPPARFLQMRGKAQSDLWKEVQFGDEEVCPTASPGSYKVYVIRNTLKEISRRGTLHSGYNTAKGGSVGTAKPIRIGESEFASWGEAALRHGVDPSVFALRLSRLKWTPEQAAEIKPREKFARHRVVVDGQTYRSLRAAAEYFGRSYKKVHDRHISKGWSLEQALDLAPSPERGRRRGPT